MIYLFKQKMKQSSQKNHFQKSNINYKQRLSISNKNRFGEKIKIIQFSNKSLPSIEECNENSIYLKKDLNRNKEMSLFSEYYKTVNLKNKTYISYKSPKRNENNKGNQYNQTNYLLTNMITMNQTQTTNNNNNKINYNRLNNYNQYIYKDNFPYELQINSHIENDFGGKVDLESLLKVNNYSRLRLSFSKKGNYQKLILIQMKILSFLMRIYFLKLKKSVIKIQNAYKKYLISRYLYYNRSIQKFIKNSFSNKNIYYNRILNKYICKCNEGYHKEINKGCTCEKINFKSFHSKHFDNKGKFRRIIESDNDDYFQIENKVFGNENFYLPSGKFDIISHKDDKSKSNSVIFDIFSNNKENKLKDSYLKDGKEIKSTYNQCFIYKEKNNNTNNKDNKDGLESSDNRDIKVNYEKERDLRILNIEKRVLVFFIYYISNIVKRSTIKYMINSLEDKKRKNQNEKNQKLNISSYSKNTYTNINNDLNYNQSRSNVSFLENSFIFNQSHFGEGQSKRNNLISSNISIAYMYNKQKEIESVSNHNSNISNEELASSSKIYKISRIGYSNFDNKLNMLMKMKFYNRKLKKINDGNEFLNKNTDTHEKIDLYSRINYDIKRRLGLLSIFLSFDMREDLEMINKFYKWRNFMRLEKRPHLQKALTVYKSKHNKTSIDYRRMNLNMVNGNDQNISQILINNDDREKKVSFNISYRKESINCPSHISIIDNKNIKDLINNDMNNSKLSVKNINTTISNTSKRYKKHLVLFTTSTRIEKRKHIREIFISYLIRNFLLFIRLLEFSNIIKNVFLKINFTKRNSNQLNLNPHDENNISFDIPNQINDDNDEYMDDLYLSYILIIQQAWRLHLQQKYIRKYIYKLNILHKIYKKLKKYDAFCVKTSFFDWKRSSFSIFLKENVKIIHNFLKKRLDKKKKLLRIECFSKIIDFYRVYYLFKLRKIISYTSFSNKIKSFEGVLKKSVFKSLIYNLHNNK